jgi:putative FmdB family regulatory protein
MLLAGTRGGRYALAMPIYEFVCAGCSEGFEELVTMGGEASVVCPSCGASDVTKLLSQFSAGRSAEALAVPTGGRSGGCCGGACGCGH